jgi:hypothetical protein
MQRSVIHIYCCFSVFFCGSLLSAYPAGWSDDILLTPEDSVVRLDPDITVDTFHNVWAVWDTAMWVNGTGEILFSKRDSLGCCMIPETDISNNASYSLGPRIAVDASNNVQIVWRDETPLGMGLWHTRLANDGSIFTPSHMAVSGNNGGYCIGMALNRYNEINVIWNDNIAGHDQISYSKLDSTGNPIIAKMKVSPANFDSYWPGIGIDSMANVHMAYRVDDTITIDHLLYTKLDRYGNVLIDNKFLDNGDLPTIIADRSQNIHMVYGDPTVPHVAIKYLKLDQNGNILKGPLILNPYPYNYTVHMAMDSLQYLHVVWCWCAGTGVIMYAKLDTNGNFVIPPVPIVYSPYSIYPGEQRIAVDLNNRLHMVWMDQRMDSAETADIFYKRGENESGIQEQGRQNPFRICRLNAAPNPFTKETRISFLDFQKQNTSEINIYDIAGKLVDKIIIESSVGSAVWRGTDRTGKHLPPGLYIARLDDIDNQASTVLILLK